MSKDSDTSPLMEPIYPDPPLPDALRPNRWVEVTSEYWYVSIITGEIIATIPKIVDDGSD